jgi:drug/metabolite transporter (DMT)-like permease
VLGALLAVLSALTFALNNATVRRGVVTGTPFQAMAITVPLGVLCFLPVALATGEIFRLAEFPPTAAAWMAGVGLLHFVFGRYCNYRANQEAGVNLTAPVVQLQIVVTLILAVIVLGEPCTLLQTIGGVLILIGSLITQRQPPRRADAAAGAGARMTPAFAPRYVAGYLFASLAALGYGTSPIMARFALAHTGPTTGLLGGLIAYAAATALIALVLPWPPLRRNVTALKRENIRWFVYSGVFVALAQGFFFAAVAVAPVLVVMPILQLSLVFRLILSTWLNPHHEVIGWLVILGAAVSVVGAATVSIDTGVILQALAVPDDLGRILRWRV